MFCDLETWDPLPLRRVLQRNGFTQKGLVEMGLEGVAFKGRASGCLKAALPPNTRMNALARLFMLGEAIPVEGALELFGSDLGGLNNVGLIKIIDGAVCSTLQLTPLAEGWFGSDFLRMHQDAPEDFVMGLSPVTRMLTYLTPRWKGAEMLELGCGAGWLSLDLRRAGLDVTATDFSNRALEIARFNARINQISGVEWLEGSWFEPLAGRKFDVISCNPPYVQSPGSVLAYRETAPGAENPCAHILRHVSDHLQPGGIACVVLNWSHPDPDSWRDAPLAWAPEQGLRRWLFQSKCHGPAEYAWRWIDHDSAFESSAAAHSELDRWVSHFQSSGIGAISSGIMFVQRCEMGEEWTRTDSRASGELTPACGAEVRRLFANESWLRTQPTEAQILGNSYLVPDGIRTEISTQLGKSGWQDRTIRLTSPGRLCYDGQVDENLMRLLEILRKGGTPRTMLAELRSRPEFAENPTLDSKIAELVRELARFSLIGLETA